MRLATPNAHVCRSEAACQPLLQLGLLGAFLVACLTTGCAVAPPRSQFPDGAAAIARMRASFECARGIQASAKIDHFGDRGRIRGDVQLFAVDPARVRFDVLSPFGVLLATLTSDGEQFSFFDLTNKQFVQGDPSPCNIARLTQVKLPADALIKLLRGEAPLLVHEPGAPTIRWNTGGFYELTIPSKYEATQLVQLAPVPSDFDRPYSEQRLRVLGVTVTQRGYVHYRAELSRHEPSTTMPPRKDPDGVDEDLQPSGPACVLDVPRSIHVTMPNTGDDLIIQYRDVGLNPPLPPGVFTQPIPGGVQRGWARCEE